MAVSLWVTDYAVSQRKASVRALNRWLTTSHTQQQIFRRMICAKTWPKDQTRLGLEGFKPGVCFQMRPCWERFPFLLTHLTQRRTGTKCILPLQTLTESYYLVLSEVHSVCYYCPSLSYRAAQVCPSCDSFNHRCAHSYVGLVASLHPQYGEAERTRYYRSTACTRKNATLLESHTANKWSPL